MTHKYLNTNTPCDQYHELLGEISSKSGNYDVADKYEDLLIIEKERVKSTMTRQEYQKLSPVQKDELSYNWYDIVNNSLRKILNDL